MNDLIEKLATVIKTNPDFEIRDIDTDIPVATGSSYEFDKSHQTSVYQNMGATIIDCILQAGMNYERAVKPRVTKFRQEYFSVKTTSDFYNLISQNPLEQIINWKGVKVERIKTLTELFIKEKIETEFQLKDWLNNDSNVLKLLRLNGIKDKTIDYLKILTGDENTIAMDVHLQNFIKTYGGLEKPLDYHSGKMVLIELSKKVNIKPFLLDHSIWFFMSKKK